MVGSAFGAKMTPDQEAQGVKNGLIEFAKGLDNVTRSLQQTDRALRPLNQPRDSQGRFVSRRDAGMPSYARTHDTYMPSYADRQAMRQQRTEAQLYGGQQRANGAPYDKIVQAQRIAMRDMMQMRQDRGAHSAQAENLKLAGDIAGVFGPYGQAVKKVTDMLYGLDAAGRAYDRSLTSFRAMEYESGGTKQEQARAGLYADVLGMKPEGFTRLSRRFADQISSDPYAMHYAGMYGVHDAPGPMNGNIDKMGQLLDWTEKLRHMSDVEAIRASRATGTEELLNLRDIKEPDWLKLKYASEFEASRNSKPITDKAMERITRDVAEGAINPPLSRDWERGINYDWRNGDPHPMIPRGEDGRRLPDFDTWRRQQMPEGRFQGPGQNGSNTQERQTTAAERTANATEAIHSLIRAGRYGGGERAAGAVPSAYIGAGWATRQLNGMAHALGAFTL